MNLSERIGRRSRHQGEAGLAVTSRPLGRNQERMATAKLDGGPLE
jgi:hypothetical protein